LCFDDPKLMLFNLVGLFQQSRTRSTVSKVL
jgi:hypothetical protein